LELAYIAIYGMFFFMLINQRINFLITELLT